MSAPDLLYYDIYKNKSRENFCPSEVINSVDRKDNFLKIILNSAPVMLFALDQDGTVTLLEGRGFDGFEFDRKPPVGELFADVFSEFPSLVSAIENAFQGEQPASFWKTKRM